MHSLTKNIQYNKKVKQLPISSVSSMLKQAFFNYITNWKLMCKKYCNTLCDQLSFTLQQSCKAVQNQSLQSNGVCPNKVYFLFAVFVASFHHSFSLQFLSRYSSLEPLLLQDSTYLAAAELNGDRDNKYIETKTQIAHTFWANKILDFSEQL